MSDTTLSPDTKALLGKVYGFILSQSNAAQPSDDNTQAPHSETTAQPDTTA